MVYSRTFNKHLSSAGERNNNNNNNANNNNNNTRDRNTELDNNRLITQRMRCDHSVRI